MTSHLGRRFLLRLLCLLRLAGLAALSVCAGLASADVVGAPADPAPVRVVPATPQTLRVQLPAGTADVDVYWPDAAVAAPLVIIAHGFARDRHNMSGWGQHLASEGFVAVAPDLPAFSDHALNGRFIAQLQAYFIAGATWALRIDPTRVALAGFSAGGLSSLLAAAGSPDVALWVGLDPVDRDGLGVRAAPRVRARALVITAEPSACNAQGNARDIVAALPRVKHLHIPGAVHGDAEWPTSWLADRVCGLSTQEPRAAFRQHATQALREALAAPTLIAPPTDLQPAR